MSEHTPTPWSVDPVSRLDVRGPDGLDVAVSLSKAMHDLTIGMSTVGPVTREDAYANAAHIVLCVNAHEELVEALKATADALLKIVLDGGGCDHSVGICWCAEQRALDSARHALSKVEAK